MSRRSSSIHIVIVVLVVLLCVGTGVYSFLSLQAVDDTPEINLYTLVPDDAMVVIETDRMDELVREVDNLHCSQAGHYLYFSDLFVYTKNYLYAYAADAPHGINPQMNKMLLSLHDTVDPENQVMYCSLGAGDIEQMEQFIAKYASGKYPPKTIDYRGQTIHIYPVADGRFLAAIYNNRFVAVSFRMSLIQRVVDTYRSGHSLLSETTFSHMQAGRRPGVAATVYTRVRSVDLGPTADADRSPVIPLGDWSEFDLRFDGDGIYCSGVSHQADTLSTFFRQVADQQPIVGLPGSRLPSTTMFHVHSPVLTAETLPYFIPVIPPADGSLFASGSPLWRMRGADEPGPALSDELTDFIVGEGRGEILACLFMSNDTHDTRPCAVISLSAYDGVRAERRMRAMESAHYGRGVATPFLAWTFHHGRMLIAPDERSLTAYVKAIDVGDTLEGSAAYQAGTAPLSSTYNFLMMANLERMSTPELQGCVRAIPNFFLRQSRFFGHFYLAAQFTTGEGTVYPNLTLIYNE